MVLRRYRPADCAEMARLFYQTVHTVNAGDYTEAQLGAWAPETMNLEDWSRSFARHITSVALDEGQIVGFGDMDDVGYLDRLYVHRDFQGQGIGTAVCNWLEERVPAAVYTTHASITARPFFVRRGYRTVKRQQVVRRGVVLVNYVMEKSGFPDRLDNAEVLFYTDRGRYGTIDTPTGKTGEAAAYLAACVYPGGGGVYLFLCNERYEVITDSLYDTIAECLTARRGIVWHRKGPHSS